MMVDLGDRGSYRSHRFQKLRRKREIEDEYRVAGNRVQHPRLAVMHRPIGGCIAKLAPGSISGAEAIEAVGVVNNKNWRLSRHAQ
ncbi:hypothetical protein [Ferribacterium limneticum]|uniref:hypothetical protein n=1 Tax=Ferribacterium limneticum TaxID=76259 RepID=UPI001CFB5E89|nr:hypothetical protein [Ferribacterium limneticum]